MSKLSLTNKLQKKSDSPRTPCRPANRTMDSSANPSSPYELCMFDSPIYEDSTAGIGWITSNDSSPVIITMSQRALTLGCDVTWADSPKRRSTSTPKHITDQENEIIRTSPTTTASMVMRRQNHRPKQIFKPTSPNPQQPKKGIHKFMENVRKLRMQESLNQQDEQQNIMAATSSEYENIQLLNTPVTTATSTMSSGSDSLLSVNNNLANKSSTNDLLSKSVQNEFLNDSDFDIELIISSQEAEERLKKKEETKSSNATIISSSNLSDTIEPIYTVETETVAASAVSTATKQSNWLNCLEHDDSIDDYMVSKEIDDIILTQGSSSTSTTTTNSSLSFERHKSMPPHSNYQPATVVGNNNSKIFERHNSLPNKDVITNVRTSNRSSCNKNKKSP